MVLALVARALLLSSNITQIDPPEVGTTLRISDTGEQDVQGFRSARDIAVYFEYYWAVYGDGETDPKVLKERKAKAKKYAPFVQRAKKAKNMIPMYFGQRFVFLEAKAIRFQDEAVGKEPNAEEIPYPVTTRSDRELAVYFRVKCKNGPNANETFLVSDSMLGTLDLEPGELFNPSGGKGGFLSAFETSSLDAAKEALRIGDQRVFNGLVNLDRIQVNKNGTVAAFHSSSDGYKRIRIESGPHKGKLVWVDPIDTKVAPLDPYEYWKPTKKKT